jgi:hypothetical protein
LIGCVIQGPTNILNKCETCPNPWPALLRNDAPLSRWPDPTTLGGWFLPHQCSCRAGGIHCAIRAFSPGNPWCAWCTLSECWCTCGACDPRHDSDDSDDSDYTYSSHDSDHSDDSDDSVAFPISPGLQRNSLCMDDSPIRPAEAVLIPAMMQPQLIEALGRLQSQGSPMCR